MAGECMAAGELVRLPTREHTALASWQVFSLGGGDTSLGGWHQVVKAPPEHMSLDECHRNHSGKGMSLKCSAENSGFTKAFERGEPKVRANLVKKPLEQPLPGVMRIQSNDNSNSAFTHSSVWSKKHRHFASYGRVERAPLHSNAGSQ